MNQQRPDPTFGAASTAWRSRSSELNSSRSDDSRLGSNHSELPGLNFLAAQLEMAQEGHFPHLHPFDRIDLQRSNVYRNKAYHPDMAAVIFAARDKVADPKSS